jgi:hypothetical protein
MKSFRSKGLLPVASITLRPQVRQDKPGFSIDMKRNQHAN